MDDDDVEGWASVRLLTVALDKRWQPYVLVTVEQHSSRCVYFFVGGRRQLNEQDPVVTAKRELAKETAGLLSSELLTFNSVGYFRDAGRAVVFVNVIYNTTEAVWTIPQRYKQLAVCDRDPHVSALTWMPLFELERRVLDPTAYQVPRFTPYAVTLWFLSRQQVYACLASRLDKGIGAADELTTTPRRSYPERHTTFRRCPEKGNNEVKSPAVPKTMVKKEIQVVPVLLPDKRQATLALGQVNASSEAIVSVFPNGSSHKERFSRSDLTVLGPPVKMNIYRPMPMMMMMKQGNYRYDDDT